MNDRRSLITGTHSASMIYKIKSKKCGSYILLSYESVVHEDKGK